MIPSCTDLQLPSPANLPIYSLFDGKVLAFTSGMTIDADGAPNAYHPQNEPGLDYLANAGHTGNWWAVITDNGMKDGEPVVQQSGPFAGYYISQTTLQDSTKSRFDITRYVDATQIPFHVLPGTLLPLHGTGNVGDLALVFNPANGKVSASIFADTGPSDHLGEGSIKLADNLGLPSDLKDPNLGAGADDGIVYLILPYTRFTPPWPVDVMAIEQRVKEYVDTLGGWGDVCAYLQQQGFF